LECTKKKSCHELSRKSEGPPKGKKRRKQYYRAERQKTRRKGTQGKKIETRREDRGYLKKQDGERGTRKKTVKKTDKKLGNRIRATGKRQKKKKTGT